MRDLTQGPITGHLVAMSLPIAVGMLAQTLYFLIDLYFVARLGDTARAGVGAAGIAMFVVLAMTHTLGVGGMALIAQAVGRKDPVDADLVFNQSLSLAGFCTVGTLVGGYALTGWYMRVVGADAETMEAGATYLYWYLPGLALQYGNIVMMSGLRGTGVVRPTMIVQVATVLLNAVLAPVLIAGWGTGVAMGVAGAGLASSLSVAAGTLMLAGYFARLEKYIHFRPALWRPRLAVWSRMIDIGLPVGGEFAFMFLYMAVIYWVIRDFGAAAQAGFGLGSRLMQSIFLPAMAVAFATGPIAGQNFGARQFTRVRETFASAAKISVVVMLALTLLCQWRPEWLVQGFTDEAPVIEVASHFLRLISWNFAASGLIFTCSGIFQGLGHTWPALGSTASRVVTFMLPALYLSTLPGLEIDHVWYLSVASVWIQAAISLILLRRTMRARLGQNPITSPAVNT
jgi:putative MATE family efflux protein